jgi:hypothetical protein
VGFKRSRPPQRIRYQATTLGAFQQRVGLPCVRSLRDGERCERGKVRELSHAIDALQGSFNLAFEFEPWEASDAADTAKRQDEAIGR